MMEEARNPREAQESQKDEHAQEKRGLSKQHFISSMAIVFGCLRFRLPNLRHPGLIFKHQGVRLVLSTFENCTVGGSIQNRVTCN